MWVSGDGKDNQLDAWPCEEVKRLTRECMSEGLTHESLEMWNHSMSVSSR